MGGFQCHKYKMETRMNNLAGNFEEYEITCPKCDSKNVVISADENGYFGVIECGRCGFRNYSKI
ncbi:hypothetical protein GOV12_06085 [Candidatus Pacearchaeota archaeon]|nr:hypothetical protein [Candidatus Pacearchaeota archaeon]